MILNKYLIINKVLLVTSLIIFLIPWYYLINSAINIQKEQKIPRKIIYQ